MKKKKKKKTMEQKNYPVHSSRQILQIPTKREDSSGKSLSRRLIKACALVR